MIDRFVSQPSGTTFPATHVVGETFDRRDIANHLPIEKVTDADTLESLAYDVFQLPLTTFETVNPQLSRTNRLPRGTMVRVPDPAFVPIVAAWLSARIVGSNLTPMEKSALLDTVLARLVQVSPQGFDVDRIEAACRLVDTTEPPAAYEYR